MVRAVKQEKYPPLLPEALPVEYGEDSITLLPVNPTLLFTFWEVREDTRAMYSGDLLVRVYDVLGVDFDVSAANSYFEKTLHERIGDQYIAVNPQRQYIIELSDEIKT